MDKVAKPGVSAIGIVFLVLALINFLKGDDWVVWFVLGVVFGGMSGVLTLFGKSKV